MPGRTSAKSPKDARVEQAEGRAHRQTSQPALSVPYANVLAVQRTAGNHAISRLLQRETSSSGMIQTKLTVGQPEDQHEQEADRVAQQVMQMPDPEITEGAAISRRASRLHILRTGSEQEKELQRQRMEEREILQSREIPDRTPETDMRVKACISAICGGGQPLVRSVRTFFESRFGYHFGQVRVHADSEAAKAARAMNARAFTMGRDIVFGVGEYAPETAAGRQLLAHELTHVVQQRGQPVGSTGARIINPPSNTGQQASIPVAKTFTGGQEGLGLSSPGAAVHIQRQLFEPRQVSPTEEPILRPMSQEAWEADLRRASDHENLYFRHFENTQSAAESGYPEAVRLFEQKSKKTTGAWQTFLVNAFTTTLGLLPGFGSIKEGFVRLLTGTGQYAEKIQALLKFAVDTVSKYGGTVHERLRETPTGNPAISMPELFQETRRVRAKEITWVYAVKQAWEDAHEQVLLGEGKYLFWLEHDRLEPQFKETLQPVAQLGENTDFIREYEAQLWLKYLSEDVEKYVNIYPGGAIFYFYNFDQDRMDYLRERFGWNFYFVFDTVRKQRSTVKAFELLFWDWNRVR